MQPGSEVVERWETFEGGKPRAPRSWLQLPVRYRTEGQREWQEGQMQNISRSGLLFHARQLQPLLARLELTFVLPAGFRGEPEAMVVCRGSVTRTVAPETQGARPALAIEIEEYEFVRGTPAPGGSA